MIPLTGEWLSQRLEDAGVTVLLHAFFVGGYSRNIERTGLTPRSVLLVQRQSRPDAADVFKGPEVPPDPVFDPKRAKYWRPPPCFAVHVGVNGDESFCCPTERRK